tara:strand:- start:308 stop:715 length:408 start_codon:yes stop_codon:yes gene_type:complete
MMNSDKMSMQADRVLVLVGAVLGLTAIVAGTFAAHVVPDYLDERAMKTFETAVRYHTYHALATIAAAWVWSRWPGRMPMLAGWMFVAGAVLFSGSLYVLVSTGAKWLGMVAPIGGSAMIVGWLLLAMSPFTSTSE